MPNQKTNLLRAMEPVIQQQSEPFDAYRIAKLTGHSPMDVGRALAALASSGRLNCLGEAPVGSLAERYALA